MPEAMPRPWCLPGVCKARGSANAILSLHRVGIKVNTVLETSCQSGVSRERSSRVCV